MTYQRDIRAGGHVVGGNFTDNSQETTIYNPRKTRLGGLIEQLRDRIHQDPAVAEFVESLLSWMAPKRTTLRRDLATKLNACGKGHLIPDALEAKERFAKQLKRTAFNPSLQEIYAYILGEVHSSFIYRIKPKVAASIAPGEIEAELANLGDSITSQIADAPVELGIGLPEVIGMLYYLTGNCYIDWDYYDSVSSSD
jgi:hypothetical protein